MRNWGAGSDDEAEGLVGGGDGDGLAPAEGEAVGLDAVAEDDEVFALDEDAQDLRLFEQAFGQVGAGGG